jgi:hypothetical protein
MFRRTFQGNAPYITFTRTWEQVPFGNFVPGQTVQIAYDPNRLPQERSSYDGVPTWSITAFYQFAPNGPVQSRQLDMPAGPSPVRFSPDAVEATFMTTSIDIPDDAGELILWFLNTGQSGMTYWDSAYGANYVFRFTSLDIEGQEANVTSDPATPYSAFNVSMTALLVVENPEVAFQVTNNPPGQPLAGTIALTPGQVENGRRAWSAGGIAVPDNARIRFSFRYTVDGRTFLDDNDGTGFWAPKPLPTHDPVKFAQAIQTRDIA